MAFIRRSKGQVARRAIATVDRVGAGCPAGARLRHHSPDAGRIALAFPTRLGKPAEMPKNLQAGVVVYPARPGVSSAQHLFERVLPTFVERADRRLINEV